jgi:hypothetical protein
MSSNLLKGIKSGSDNNMHSLKQSLKFKKAQDKLKGNLVKKEGFTTNTNSNAPAYSNKYISKAVQNSNKLVNSTSTLQNNLNKLQELQDIFNATLEEYQTAQSNISAKTTAYINENSSQTGALLNTNVIVNSVVSDPTSTYLGAYTDNATTPTMTPSNPVSFMTLDQCQSIAANNGSQYFGLQNVQPNGTALCYTSNSLSNIEQYGVAGPLCSQGSDNFNYGGPSTNAVYQVPDATYVGTFNDNPNRAMALVNGGSQSFSYQSCKNYAINNGYTFFALQNGNAPGNAQCAVSNNWSTCSQYGQKGDGNFSSVDNKYYGNGWGNSIYQVQSSSQSNYIGCYADNPANRAMNPVNGGSQSYSFSTCQQAASSAGAKFFGLQNGTNGTAQCFISNSQQQATQYGVSQPTTTISGNVYGNYGVNAVYQMGEVGDPTKLGNVGYVTNEGELMQYPSSMYNSSTGVLTNDNSCPSDVSNTIDSIEWNSLTNNGNLMSPSTKCGLASSISNDAQSLDQLKSKLAFLSAAIIALATALEASNSVLDSQKQVDQNILKEMITKYTAYNKQFSSYNDNNVQGIVEDTSITTLRDNYMYVFWSILAIALIITTIKIIKK